MARTSPTIVVFDIGKVLLDWDPRHLYRRIFPDSERMESFLREVLPTSWILETDRGKPFADAVAERIMRFPDHADAIRPFDHRWLETVAGPIAGSVALLERLQARGVPTYSITNFSAEKFEIARTAFPFLDSFRGIVVSGRERLLKPDAAIYRTLFDRHAVDPADCLFIDDSAANVAAARTLGMHAHHFEHAQGLAEALKHYGLFGQRDT